MGVPNKFLRLDFSFFWRLDWVVTGALQAKSASTIGPPLMALRYVTAVAKYELNMLALSAVVSTPRLKATSVLVDTIALSDYP